jgi:predicted amidophosphoribosyltransferase
MGWGRALVGVLLPTACSGCGAHCVDAGSWTLCGDCVGALPTLLGPMELGGSLATAWHWGWYDGPEGLALRRGKYRPDPSAVRDVAPHLARAVQGRLPRVDVVVPVPQSTRAWLTRGFSPVQALADGVGAGLGRPVVDLLRRIGGKPQASQARSARSENVRGTFHARQEATDLRVLLVDDVVTTGATAQTCADALLCAGARSVHLLAALRVG